MKISLKGNLTISLPKIIDNNSSNHRDLENPKIYPVRIIAELIITKKIKILFVCI